MEGEEESKERRKVEKVMTKIDEDKGYDKRKKR